MDSGIHLKCDNCSFRFNSISHKPVVLHCGDSICRPCSKRMTNCCICFQAIDKNIEYTINKNLMKNAQEQKQNIDMLVKICFIGQSGVGKSSLMKALIGQPFTQLMESTLGVDIQVCHRHVKGLNLKFHLWDTAGSQKFKCVARNHYQNADIIIVTYDLFETAQQNSINFWLNQATTQGPKDATVVIVGNKKDLIDQTTNVKAMETYSTQFIQPRYPHIEVSCKTMFGISDFWKLIDKKIIQGGKKLNPSQIDKIQKGNNTPSHKVVNSIKLNNTTQNLRLRDRIKQFCC